MWIIKFFCIVHSCTLCVSTSLHVVSPAFWSCIPRIFSHNTCDLCTAVYYVWLAWKNFGVSVNNTVYWHEKPGVYVNHTVYWHEKPGVSVKKILCTDEQLPCSDTAAVCGKRWSIFQSPFTENGFKKTQEIVDTIGSWCCLYLTPRILYLSSLRKVSTKPKILDTVGYYRCFCLLQTVSFSCAEFLERQLNDQPSLS